jgi:Type IV secretion system pilin
MSLLLHYAILFILFIFPLYTYADCGINNTYPNPISFCSFRELAPSIAKTIIQIVVPFAVIAIIFIGLRLVVAATSGNTNGLQNAKQALIYVLIGTAIVIGATALAYAVINTLRNT